MTWVLVTRNHIVERENLFLQTALWFMPPWHVSGFVYRHTNIQNYACIYIYYFKILNILTEYAEQIYPHKLENLEKVDQFFYKAYSQVCLKSVCVTKNSYECN